MQLLQHLAHHEQKTIILSTHDVELALQFADHLWLLGTEGIVQGAPATLAADGSIARFFQTEACNSMLPPFVSPSVYNSIKHRFFTHDSLYCRKTQCSQRHSPDTESHHPPRRLLRRQWLPGDLDLWPPLRTEIPRGLHSALEALDLGALPMVPPRFGIRLKNDRGVQKQFAIIQSLMPRPTKSLTAVMPGRKRTHTALGDAESRRAMSR